jgi:hypothetical protein
MILPGEWGADMGGSGVELTARKEIQKPDLFYAREVDFFGRAQDEAADITIGNPPGITALCCSAVGAASFGFQEAAPDPYQYLVNVDSEGVGQGAGGVAVKIALDAEAVDLYLNGGDGAVKAGGGEAALNAGRSKITEALEDLLFGRGPGRFFHSGNTQFSAALTNSAARPADLAAGDLQRIAVALTLLEIGIADDRIDRVARYVFSLEARARMRVSRADKLKGAGVCQCHGIL